MSDIDVMAAIIEQKAYGKDIMDRTWRATTKSSVATAQALHAAGFRMSAGTVDQAQNDALAALQARVSRLEGWAGLPQ
ncbi:hypothetical protein FDH96_gp096 [Mycobacterium phage Rey]|uniref:Uncharacterized protein n=1 Tax=Mycobacterium phage Rey TaxID=1034115 RepID=G1D5F8_9CAUD|nr:hypothetical protein FDH96_gp096 [Mycobacterium phage Rey]AEK10007.1 hypothetical protein PBI_REY_96 [Mycobacterium phage Rey]